MLSPSPAVQPSQWRRDLKAAIRAPKVLGEFLGLPEPMIAAAGIEVENGFPFLVPWSFAKRMQPANLQDPLLLQVWPVSGRLPNSPAQELNQLEFVDDPVGDSNAVVAEGLLHKYQGRVLLVTTGACAIHCRYCFRQNFPYQDVPHSLASWQPALDYIRADTTIHEVILSGGDPLTIVDSVLSKLVQALEHIPHLKRLRLHTRLPIVLPSRINTEFIYWLSESRLSKWLVIHANHRNELDEEVASAIQKIKEANCMVLNQSVLLKGINDTPIVQQELCERLIDLGVLPYYLHQLDRVRGAEDFETSAHIGPKIIEHLRQNLPGYAVPKLVCEIAGEPSKTPIQ